MDRCSDNVKSEEMCFFFKSKTLAVDWKHNVVVEPRLCIYQTCHGTCFFLI